MPSHIKESSLSRLYSNKKYDCAQISAFRGKNKRKVNVENHKKLGKELRDLGFFITQTIGAYQYEGAEKADKELSWFVADKNNLGTLKDTVIELGVKYKQESVLFAPSMGKSYLIWTRTEPFSDEEIKDLKEMGVWDKVKHYKVGDRTANSAGKVYGKKHANNPNFSMVGGRKYADNIDYNFNIKKMNEQSDKYKYDFDTVYESFYSHFTAAYFQKGDVIAFDKSILSDPALKEMPEEIRMKVEDMVKAQLAGDANIVISNISLNPFITDQYEPSSITIAYATAGNMYYGEVAISGSLGKYMKIVSGVDALLTKKAIKRASDSTRTKVDMDVVKQAFSTGYSKDVRQTENS